MALKSIGMNHFEGTYPIEYGGPTNSYLIKAINSEGLSRTSPSYQFIATSCDFVVAQEVANPNFLIFPNPASSTLTIHRNSAARTTILIEDFLGRKVRRFEASSESPTLDVHNIPTGIYECIITDASGHREALPFVKE